MSETDAPTRRFIHNPAPAHERPTPIGDITVSSTYLRDEFCAHDTIELIEQGNIVRCRLCGDTLSAFWALQQVHRQFALANERLEVKREQIAASYRQRITFIAAKRLEQAWRRRGTVPACPHCRRGILVDDRIPNVSKETELDLRRSKEAQRDQERLHSGDSNG